MSQTTWTSSQLKKLGNCIRNDEIPGPELPDYDTVMLHYNDLATETQTKIENMDWTSLLGSRKFEVTSRAKTFDTLRQKLQRDKTLQLPNVQDIAGVRFEAEMNLREQDDVADRIADQFSHDKTTCINDLRHDPHSGYRAVHLRLILREGVHVRGRVEPAWVCGRA